MAGKKEIIVPNPAAPLLSKLNLSPSKVTNFFDYFKDKQPNLKRMRIRGHSITAPTKPQIYDKYHATLNQARILTWTIFDKTDECNDSDYGQWKQRDLSQIDLLVVHCTDNDHWNYAQVASYDMSPENHITPGKPLPGITYHMMVSKTGDTLLTSNFRNITWHAGGYNSHSVGIAIPYRATGAKNPPSSPITRGLVRTLAILVLRFKLDPYHAIKGHRELLGTGFRMVHGHKRLRKTCPGMLVDLDNLRLQVAIEVQKILARVSTTNSELISNAANIVDVKLYSGEIDGVVGPKTKKAIKYFYSEALDLLIDTNTPKVFIGDEWDSDVHKYKYGVFDE